MARTSVTRQHHHRPQRGSQVQSVLADEHRPDATGETWRTIRREMDRLHLEAGTLVDQVVAPVIVGAADSTGGDTVGYGDAAGAPAASQEQAPPGTPACPSCRRALATGLLIRPRCGTDLG